MIVSYCVIKERMLNLKLCWVRHSYICQLKYLSVLLSVVYYGENINLMIIHEIYKWKLRKLYRNLFFFALRYICLNIFPFKAIFRGKIFNCKGTGPCTKKVHALVIQVTRLLAMHIRCTPSLPMSVSHETLDVLVLVLYFTQSVVSTCTCMYAWDS